MRSKIWIAGWSILVLGMLTIIGVCVYRIDPYIHYHQPDTDTYYYALDNQRSQNDGVSKHFDYNALITGTSMTENCKTSEIDDLFGVHSIKVPYSGGSYKEINDNIRTALNYNPDLSLIIRGLDTGRFMHPADEMREDLGTYPTYLYDDNPFNDVQYLFNKDVIFGRIYEMLRARQQDGFEPGITSFDQYSSWQSYYTFGIQTVAPDGITFAGKGDAVHLSDEDRRIVYENITQNVTAIADEYPDVVFGYFFTPYSILYYKSLVEDGTIYQQLEAEEYVIELILQHENIRLFSFNGIEELITDLNNYKDLTHYGTWVNSYMLQCMRDNEHRLTKENYKLYLQGEYELFIDYDYNGLNGQEDYDDDWYAVELLNGSDRSQDK